MKSILGFCSVVCHSGARTLRAPVRDILGNRDSCLVHGIPCQMRSAGAGLRESCGLVGSLDEKAASAPPCPTQGQPGLCGVGFGLFCAAPPAGFGSGGVIPSFAHSQGQGEGFSRGGKARELGVCSWRLPPPTDTAPGILGGFIATPPMF